MSTAAQASRLSGVRRILATWGPAWLVMIADVDAASVITAAESGAQYGTRLIWFLLVLILPLFVIQEVAGRVGAVTGRGLGELVRSHYGKRVAILAAVPMALVDIISYVVQYTGAAIGFQVLGIPPLISVPVVFVAHLLLVYKRRYAEAEKPLLAISILFALAWVVAAFLTTRRGLHFMPFYPSSAPAGPQIPRIHLAPFYFSASSGFIFLLAANVGAVIMPFMLFFQASATAEKGISGENLRAVRIETALGAVVSEILMSAIALASVGVKSDSLRFAMPKVLSRGLASVGGSFAPYLFAVGLIAAAFIALIVVSLGSSWGVTEAMGWRRNNWFKVYLVESVPALAIPIVSLNLIDLALSLMVLQIVVLVGPAVTLGLVCSNRKLMGERSLRGFNRIVYWAFLGLIFATGAATLAFSH